MATPPSNVLVRMLDSRDSAILVVDDEPAGRDLLSSLLSSQGYSVKTASDGEAALAQLAAGGIRLVLLDLMMAKMDGVELCTHIRRDPAHALLPVVFTTSLHDRASRIRAKEAGADDYLVKPIDAMELLVRVERLLRIRAQTELLSAERDRLARELSRARNGGQGDAVITAPTPAPSLDELVHEHRRLVADALRASAPTEGQDVRPLLEALLRSAEEIERRVSAPSISFPWKQTRSTL